MGQDGIKLCLLFVFCYHMTLYQYFDQDGQLSKFLRLFKVRAISQVFPKSGKFYHAKLPFVILSLKSAHMNYSLHKFYLYQMTIKVEVGFPTFWGFWHILV